jgi:SWI/SNF-related matrix-associated actin-dependent regulator 1 of chromatin subfamily A
MVVSWNEERKMFIARTKYEERDIMKKAGFLWDKLGKVWFTKFPARAAMLKQACDESALGKLEAHFKALESSRATDAAIEIPAPGKLSYLPYQKAGVKFMTDRQASLNADEPGLGKTIQAIGTINANPEIRYTLVVAPTSLIKNWAREAGKWLTRDTFIEVVEDNELPEYVSVLLPDLDTATPNRNVFVITNYERLYRNPHLMATKWDAVIVDECHYVKNPEAKRSLAVYKVTSETKWKMYLSGTPMMNRPVELQPILGILDPERFGSPLRPNDPEERKKRWHFLKRYCDAHQELRGREWRWVFDGASNLDELQERLRSTLMIRRLKQDVLLELPPKRRSIIPLETKWVEPENIKRQLEAMEAADAELRLARTEDDRAAYAAAAEKLKYLNEVAFEDMAKYRHMLALSKVPAATDYITTLLESGVEKIIVFAHHRDVLEALQTNLGAYSPTLIYGGMNTEVRDQAVQRFQNDPTCRVFLGGIQAAAEGLTLTAASHVVFVEVDWVPAKITQAEDRAHRIGQLDIVFVHQLIIDNTLDAYMIKKVVWKQEVADKALDLMPTYEELDVDMDDPVDPKKQRTTVRRTKPEDREALLLALRILAGMCDGAKEQDGHGFNKLDTAFGHKMAALADLSDAQYFACYKMVRKYKRQLGGALREQLGYTEAAEKAKLKKAIAQA